MLPFINIIRIISMETEINYRQCKFYADKNKRFGFIDENNLSEYIVLPAFVLFSGKVILNLEGGLFCKEVLWH